MLFYAMIFFMLVWIAFCVIIIRYKGIQAYTELKASLTNISDYYHGTINNSGCLKNLSLEFYCNNLSAVVKTITERRRKYTEEY